MSTADWIILFMCLALSFVLVVVGAVLMPNPGGPK